MNRILAVVIAYYPDMELLSENMNAFVDHVEKVLVWDNTPDGDKELANQELPGKEKTERVGEGENKGISYVLNWAWHYAVEHGYDYLLTMDQDSLGRISAFSSKKPSYPKRRQRVSIVPGY